MPSEQGRGQAQGRGQVLICAQYRSWLWFAHARNSAPKQQVPACTGSPFNRTRDQSGLPRSRHRRCRRAKRPAAQSRPRRSAAPPRPGQGRNGAPIGIAGSGLEMQHFLPGRPTDIGSAVHKDCRHFRLCRCTEWLTSHRGFLGRTAGLAGFGSGDSSSEVAFAGSGPILIVQNLIDGKWTGRRKAVQCQPGFLRRLAPSRIVDLTEGRSQRWP